MKHFYLKQKVFSFADRYRILDDQQKVLYYCKAKFFSISHKMTLIHVPTEQPLYRFQKVLFRMMPTYHIYDLNNQVVATVKRKWSIMRPKVYVTGEQGDLNIEGTFYQHSFQIFQDQTEIASIRKKLFSWGDSYEISLSEKHNEAYLLSLVILIDSIFHNRKNRGSHAR